MPALSSSPTVLTDVLVPEVGRGQPLTGRESVSLLQSLGGVPDPRKRRGRRHSVQSVLLLALGAVLAGAQSWAAIAQWAARAEGPVLPVGPRPHATTFYRVLSAVDPDRLQQVLTTWLASRNQARQTGVDPVAGRVRQVVAFDGKTLRGARAGAGAGGQVKLAAVVDHADGLVLTQGQVAGGDELASFAPVLDLLGHLHGVLVTADALHCQRAHAAYLHDRGWHYLLTVKANQPLLHGALGGLPWGKVPANAIDRDTGHGRTESRSVKVIDLEGSPEADRFPHAARAIKIIRRRRSHRTGTTSVETVYAITSLTYTQATPEELSRVIRSHWRIENSLHWVRDVTQGEDHSTIRTGHGPRNMAALRNTTINIIRLRGGTNIAAAHRAYSYDHAAVLADITAA